MYKSTFLTVSSQAGYNILDRMVAIEKNLNSIQNIQDKNNKKAALQISNVAIQ
jgi:hypothetical protein